MIRIMLNSVREIGPRDPDGASSYAIGERTTEIFAGESRVDAVAVLQSIPIGTSVCVRHPKGLRSCMNKPALWNDLASGEILK